MLVNRIGFAEQIVQRYNAIKKDLVDILNTPNREHTPTDQQNDGKQLKKVLKELRISETELRNTLKNASSGPTIEIYIITKPEENKEEQWIKIATSQ